MFYDSSEDSVTTLILNEVLAIRSSTLQRDSFTQELMTFPQI